MNDASDLSRREFLRSAGAGTAVALVGAAEPPSALPRKKLGRTGVEVPILGLGTAPGGHRPEKEAVPFYHRCIDAGLTYIDTAPQFAGYGSAQAYLGQVLRERRKDVFLVTKCWEPDGDKALALLAANLKELQTDHADLVYAHSIGDDKMDPDRLESPTGTYRALEKARRDGLTRFLGVSGHCRPDRFRRAIDRWDFDVMMTAVSLVARHVYNFEEKVWPAAARKGIGLAAMKVYGGGTGGDKNAKGARLPDALKPAALRYAVGLPDVSVVVVGMFDDEEMRQNLAWARAYRPLTPGELATLAEPTRALAAEWKAPYGPVT
jgi:aryl-alcohol dehydrogenase-like predicted oxidoreductase